MPELPEVELAARLLRRAGAGRAISGIAIDPAAARLFAPGGGGPGALRGARVEGVDRRGKRLLIRLSRGGRPLGLLCHLGMTGKWVAREAGVPLGPSGRLRLDLGDGGALLLQDPRRFARLRVVPEARFEDAPEVAALGPDPLHDGVDPVRLAARLAGSRRAIKEALLDQSLLAGVGNIQAAEALWRARIDPRRPAGRVAAREYRALARAILASIRFTLARQGDGEVAYVEEIGAPNPFRIYGREGSACPRCRAPILRIRQGQRSTWWCPGCQR